MNWNEWIRQIHRWMSIAFTVAAIVNIVALRQKEPAVWVGLLAGGAKTAGSSPFQKLVYVR